MTDNILLYWGWVVLVYSAMPWSRPACPAKEKPNTKNVGLARLPAPVNILARNPHFLIETFPCIFYQFYAECMLQKDSFTFVRIFPRVSVGCFTAFYWAVYCAALLYPAIDFSEGLHMMGWCDVNAVTWMSDCVTPSSSCPWYELHHSNKMSQGWRSRKVDRLSNSEPPSVTESASFYCQPFHKFTTKRTMKREKHTENCPFFSVTVFQRF